MEKILVTGASGLVGSYFCRLSRSERLIRVNHKAQNVDGEVVADLTDLRSFDKILEKVGPDVIVHLAAQTDVDKCDDCMESADRVNHAPLKVIARYLEKNSSCFALYTSTDYVFEGSTGSYSETDYTKPLNWYGATKLYGEQELMRSDSKNWCIARTSTPFGLHEKKLSFPTFLIQNLSSGKRVRVLSDQVTSPTWAGNLARMLDEIVRKRVLGIMHVSGSSAISRYDQALLVASTFGLEKNLIDRASMTEMKWKAIRPINSSLNVEKAMRTLESKPISYEEGLALFSQDLRNLRMDPSL